MGDDGPVRGRPGLPRSRGCSRVPQRLERSFEEFHAEPENFAQAPEIVVADTRVSGLGKRSGVPVELQFTVVVSFRNGKIVRVRNFLERPEALEAAGLSE
jgi:ketosteroid isomerase-like protein